MCKIDWGEKVKKLILQITLIISILCSMQVTFAASNLLNAVLLEGTDKGYNIILRSDSTAKIKKKFTESGVLELSIKGLSTTNSLSTLYRNVSDVNSFVVENAGDNLVKVYIQAPNIQKANVIFETPNASPMPMHNDYTGYKFAAGVGLLVLMSVINKISNSKKKSDALAFDLKIKDREMRLMKKYRDEITTIPSINYKVRNSAYVSSTVKRPETIRKYASLNKV